MSSHTQACYIAVNKMKVNCCARYGFIFSKSIGTQPCSRRGNQVFRHGCVGELYQLCNLSIGLPARFAIHDITGLHYVVVNISILLHRNVQSILSDRPHRRAGLRGIILCDQVKQILTEFHRLRIGQRQVGYIVKVRAIRLIPNHEIAAEGRFWKSLY